MSEYVFTYGKNSKVYDWTRFVEAGIVPTALTKPSGLEPKPLNPLQRAAMNDRQIAEYELRIRDFATWRASERIRKQIEADRRAKAKNKAGAEVKPKASMPLADGADPEASGSGVKKGKKKEVWGVYRADGTKHTEGELDIGRQALMALVKTTNEFSKNANTVLLAAQKENNVELEKKIKDAVSELNRNGGLDIAKRFEKDPSKLSSRDLQTLVALMEEADDVIDSVQEFQVSTEHLNTVIQKFDLGDKLQMAERKKFATLLGMTEKGIGNSLSGLAKNSPKELTKSTGGASTVLATMLGAALGPFGDAAAMLVNSDWVSDKIEEGGGKVVDFVKGKVASARAAGKLRKKGEKGKPSADTTGDPAVQGTPESVASTPGTTTEPPVADGTVLTGAETNKGLHIKPMGIPAPFLDAKMVEKLAKEIGDEVERGMRTLYKQLGGKVFDSDDLKLYLTTMQKEIPKEMEKLAAEFPSHAEFLRDLGTSMQDALGGETRDVLGRLDTLIESAMKGQQGEAERELELNRAEKAEQKRHDELIDTLEAQGKLERKVLKKELDDVERKTGQGGGLMSTVLTALGLGGGAAGVGLGAKMLKKVPGGTWLAKKLSKLPGVGKHFVAEAADDAAKLAKPAAKSGMMKALGGLLAKVPKKGKIGAAAAGAAALLGLSSEASADEKADTVGAPDAVALPNPNANPVGVGTQLASYGAAGVADGMLQTASKTASAGGGLLKGTLLKAGTKRIPIIGGAVDGYMTYRNTGSIAQGIGAGVGNALGGLGGAAAGTAVLPGVGTVAGSVAGSIGGSMAGQELGRQLEEVPKQFAKTMTQYGTPMGLAFLALGKLSKAVGLTSKNVDETVKNVDKSSTAVGDSSKNVEKTSKDLEKTAKATEGWLARISRWNPFSGGGGKGKGKKEPPAPVVQDMTQVNAAKQARYEAIKKYLDDGGKDPQGFAKEYDANLRKRTSTADGKAEFGTGSTNDIVWNDGSGTTVIKNGLAPGAVVPTYSSGRGDLGGGVGKYAYSGGAIKGLTDEQSMALANNTAHTESAKNRDGSLAIGKMGGSSNRFAGKYQFGAGALATVGLIDQKKFNEARARGMSEKDIIHDPSVWKVKGGLDTYLKDEAMQDKAFRDLASKNIAIGYKQGALNESSTPEDIAAYAKSAHLLGAGNKAKGTGAYGVAMGRDSADAFGTTGSKYAMDARMAIRSLSDGKKKPLEASGVASTPSTPTREAVGNVASTVSGNVKENTPAQAWAAPMKYEAKTSAGARLGLPDSARPAQEQPPSTSVTDATANVNRLNRSQPTISDANFMPDDIGMMLVASGMV